MSGFVTLLENIPPLRQWAARALPPAVLLANAWPMAVIAVVTRIMAAVFIRRGLG